MRASWSVWLVSGPDLRRGELDRITERLREVMAEIEPHCDTSVKLEYEIDGPRPDP